MHLQEIMVHTSHVEMTHAGTQLVSMRSNRTLQSRCDRRGYKHWYKCWMYSHHGQYPASRGKGETVSQFRYKYATYNSSAETPTTLDQAVFEVTTTMTMTDGQTWSLDPCCACPHGVITSYRRYVHKRWMWRLGVCNLQLSKVEIKERLARLVSSIS